MLYLAYMGLDLFEIGIMESVYHVTSFTMEVPTGAIADIYGRKTSRILGRLVSVISVIVMIFSKSPIGFAISFMFSALSNNLESGAGDALIYDSMKEDGKEAEYMKVKGREEIFVQVADTLSLILGGYLATINYGLVYKMAAIIGIITLLQTLSFMEPTIGKVKREDKLMKTFVNQLTASFKVIKTDKRIAYFILASELFGILATTSFFYIQNYLKSFGRTEFSIGAVLAIGGLISAVFSANAHFLEKRYQFKGLMTGICLLAIPAFFALQLKATIEIGIVVIMALECVSFVVINDHINKLIPSEQRATILSFRSMVFSFFMILLFPVIGKIGDIFGLMNAFRIIAVLATIVLLGIIFSVRRNKL
ncbi:MAG: major facilitator superfamily 1 [Herbinix sp.]|jgi:MFS family permease|nr:major facilitator superfamily 1 [Herbinix sp.]